MFGSFSSSRSISNCLTEHQQSSASEQWALRRSSQRSQTAWPARPQPTCDRYFKKFFDRLTSLSPHFLLPLLLIHLLLHPSSSSTSLLPVVFLSQPSWLNLEIPAGGSDFPALTVTVVKSALHVLTQGQSNPAAIADWVMNEVWPAQHLQGTEILVLWTAPCEVLISLNVGLWTSVKTHKIHCALPKSWLWR